MKTISLLLLTILCLGCGYSSPKTPPAQPGVVPTIAAILPNTAKAGDPAFVLTVNGSSFNGNAVVNWNGVAQTTQRPGAGQLTTSIPASAIANAGMISVTVTNPGTPGNPGMYGGGGGTMAETSTAVTFTITN